MWCVVCRFATFGSCWIRACLSLSKESKGTKRSGYNTTTHTTNSLVQMFLLNPIRLIYIEVVRTEREICEQIKRKPNSVISFEWKRLLKVLRKALVVLVAIQSKFISLSIGHSIQKNIIYQLKTEHCCS